MSEIEREQAMQGTCPQCDGTGDVHRADGEYLGRCACPAGEWSRRDQAWADEAIAEQRATFAAQAADAEAMRKSLAGTEPCSFCSGAGIDGEECSDGYHGGGQCHACGGSGRAALSTTTEGASHG